MWHEHCTQQLCMFSITQENGKSTAHSLDASYCNSVEKENRSINQLLKNKHTINYMRNTNSRGESGVVRQRKGQSKQILSCDLKVEKSNVTDGLWERIPGTGASTGRKAGRRCCEEHGGRKSGSHGGCVGVMAIGKV